MKSFCPKNRIKNGLAITCILIMLMLITFSCGNEEDYLSENKSNNSSDSLVIELVGFTGKSVFEITTEKYDVDHVESSAGIFVKAIDSIVSTRKYAWIFSVNDSFVPVGSNDYITNDTDVIKWHYRKF
ncbi:MAG: DUF4430 domain-containing protein [candidate division Zixibacteria bacterium]|nr:DUF4430 domain-containing protein [candidate division Zixibacteria bacterium]